LSYVHACDLVPATPSPYANVLRFVLIRGRPAEHTGFGHQRLKDRSNPTRRNTFLFQHASDCTDSVHPYSLAATKQQLRQFPVRAEALKFLWCFNLPCHGPASSRLPIINQWSCSTAEAPQCSRLERFQLRRCFVLQRNHRPCRFPGLCAHSITRNGKRPFPAMSPQPPVVLVRASDLNITVGELLHDAALGARNEFDQFWHIGRIAQRLRISASRLGFQRRTDGSNVGTLQASNARRKPCVFPGPVCI